MPDHSHIYIEGGSLFFDVVTFNRLPLFNSAKGVKLLSGSAIIGNTPFETNEI